MKIAVNWNRLDDTFSLDFWKQNFEQIWSEEEISVSNDKNIWEDLSKQEKKTFQSVLASLTMLDTEQGGEGMPLLKLHTPGHQRKSVMGIMGFMEDLHAKSYSHIFSTLISQEDEDKLYDWLHTNPRAQFKAEKVASYYEVLLKRKVSDKELYMAYVASVYLESYLFYSGFFYPLYLAGQGKMTAAGEIINLIIRDESIHGLYIGMLAQELYEKLTEAEKQEVDKETIDLLVELYDNEVEWTKEMYEPIGLHEEVLTYVRYNANRALMNLGKEPYYPVEEINPIVENGLKTTTKNYDFFSLKGNGYILKTDVVYLEDEDFVIEELDEIA